MYQLLPVLARETAATRIHLQPISESAIRELLGHYYEFDQQDASRLVAYLNRHSEGTPLYFWEIVRTLEEYGHVRRAPDGWVLADLTQFRVPDLLLQVIERRVERLGRDSRRLLEVAAIIGTEIELDLLQEVGNVDTEVLAEVIDNAISASFLTEGATGPSVLFSHSMVREALYQRTSLIRRHRLHRRIADVLIARDDRDEDVIAHHLQLAGDHRAADWLIAAGERAQRTYALLTAGERFVQAAELIQGQAARRNERGWLLYRAARQFRFSDPERGIAYVDEAQRIGESVGDQVLAAYALVDRGYLYGNTGNFRQDFAHVVAGNKAIDSLPADHFQSESFRNWVANVVLRSPDSELEDQGFLDRLGGRFNPRRAVLVIVSAMVGALDEAIEVGEPFREQLAAIENPDHHLLAPYADVCSGLGIAYSHLGKPEMAREAFDDALVTMRKLDHRAMLASVTYWALHRVMLPYFTNNLSERKRLTDEAQAAVRDAQEAFFFAASPDQFENFTLMWIEGRWNEARQKAPRGQSAIFRENRVHNEIALGHIARAAGDAELAWEHVARAAPDGLSSDPHDIALITVIEAQQLGASLALDAGDLTTARDWINAQGNWLEWSGATRGRAEHALRWAEYHRLSGDPKRASHFGSEAFGFASNPRQPLALIEIHRFLGRLSAEAQHHERAEHELNESLGLAEACAAPYQAALTRLELVELHLSTGNVDLVREALCRIDPVLTTLDARPALARASILASRVDERAPSRGLTRRELDVLRLLSRGLSDPEIAERLLISRRTVNTHLTSIYRKLDVNSRTAAPLHARDQDLV